jgi:hypothetical protein
MSYDLSYYMNIFYGCVCDFDTPQLRREMCKWRVASAFKLPELVEFDKDKRRIDSRTSQLVECLKMNMAYSSSS